MFNLKKTQN